MRQLPELGGVFQYQIKSEKDGQARVFRESHTDLYLQRCALKDGAHRHRNRGYKTPRHDRQARDDEERQVAR